MKWDCDAGWKRRKAKRLVKVQAKIDSHQDWQKWYAWYPIHVKDGECCWLEYVDRKIVVDDFYLTSKYPNMWIAWSYK